MVAKKQVNVDVLVVGGGFGGVYAVWRLRAEGFKIHLFEGTHRLGGVWSNNTYPGARVDSEFPFYQLSIPEVYKTWIWKERFPDWQELQAYFDHVDKFLDVSKDATYNALVDNATFNTEIGRWTVHTEQGHVATCKQLLLCTGSTYKQSVPNWEGLDQYTGKLIHSSKWPKGGMSAHGKRVAIIGSGSTAIQIVQELSKEAKELVTLIRTPNIALPMKQRKLSWEEQDSFKGFLNGMLKTAARSSYGGYPYNPTPAPSPRQLSVEDREKFFEEQYQRGGFNFGVGNFIAMLFDRTDNRIIYDYWVKKTRARMQDPVKRDILAPLEPPNHFMAKRCSLEQDYYEMCDKDHVRVVDLKVTPIDSFTTEGLRVGGEDIPVDIIVLATGFDNYTGAFSTMGLEGTDGKGLMERWKDGVQTHLGLTAPHHPNMWMVYGPQAPTALGNGPTIVEVQVDVIVDMIKKARDENIKYLDATPEAAQAWADDIAATSKTTLLEDANSWYMGANIPGKKREMLNYLKGLVQYEKSCRDAIPNWDGFVVEKETRVQRSQQSVL
ncbi:FAD/NAD(P)-binding domain-containing protein [Karstenula rhodostoma CBS 690.94]|uniref:FAD/NAD(P)-binding domain-containing protein n=1 Tax=Karstenula rhodostoma CBS 690.94 TaxID=1392251 RepID=A0A9P4PBQ7_9PLEO|nr:FAD/NAD(P)-binding domain-containing protein [Karstenula rhodostoma CBS 690.94]